MQFFMITYYLMLDTGCGGLADTTQQAWLDARYLILDARYKDPVSSIQNLVSCPPLNLPPTPLQKPVQKPVQNRL
jgi:hypothetical protein